MGSIDNIVTEEDFSEEDIHENVYNSSTDDSNDSVYFNHWNDKFLCCDGCKNSKFISDVLWTEKENLENEITEIKETERQCTQRVERLRQLNKNFEDFIRKVFEQHCENMYAQDEDLE